VDRKKAAGLGEHLCPTRLGATFFLNKLNILQTISNADDRSGPTNSISDHYWNDRDSDLRSEQILRLFFG
jgi:hypothetical protein